MINEGFRTMAPNGAKTKASVTKPKGKTKTMLGAKLTCRLLTRLWGFAVYCSS